ncbi:Hypothetical protein BN2458_PEG1912 [Helicobacter typhlonius]|uniref:Uncharacterized protein n=1 Tax=Helicobacter typhlonius TaxID=76936 RepID=A0A0S4PWX7_9HELI|nr:Hypothetical protein BN2458_PEG1912 [Helicobacter typhlonius]
MVDATIEEQPAKINKHKSDNIAKFDDEKKMDWINCILYLENLPSQIYTRAEKGDYFFIPTLTILRRK